MSEIVWKVSGKCLEGVSGMSWRYLKDIWGQAKSGRAESEQTMSGQVQRSSSLDRSTQDRSCQDRSSQDLQTQLNMHLRMKFDSGVGHSCL